MLLRSSAVALYEVWPSLDFALFVTCAVRYYFARGPTYGTGPVTVPI